MISIPIYQKLTNYMKSDETPIVVITCCVKPQISISLSDSGIRLQQYHGSINWWLDNTQAVLIIIENSGNIERIKNLYTYEKHRQRMDFIGVSAYRDCVAKGAGSLEASMVEQGLELTRFNEIIKKTGFYKVTGRLSVLNFNQIDKENSYKNPIISWWLAKGFLNVGRVDLRFYYFTYDFYINKIISTNTLVDDRIGFWLERVYTLPIIANNHIIKPFSTYPRVSGIMAHTGRSYDGSIWIKWLVKNILYKVTKINRINKH